MMPNQPPISTKEIVILLHCLAGSPLFMLPIEKQLIKAGYQVLNLAYPSRKKDIFTLANEIQQKIASWYDQDHIKIHFVTYSLGGIILRALLANAVPANLGRIVMLAPPNQGCPVVNRLKKYRLFKWFFGPAAQQLDTHLPQILPPFHTPTEIGIIAGNKHYCNFFNALLPDIHDGLLGIEHTKFEHMTDHLIVPTSHLFIVFNSEVIKQIQWFIKKGNFFR